MRRGYNLIICVLVALGYPLGYQAAPPYAAVVESIAANSPAERAGIQTGDVLRTWARGDQSGPLDLFQLPQVEVGQSSLGVVVVTGLRGGREMRWSVAEGPWGIVSAPAFERELAGRYAEIRASEQRGDAVETARLALAAAEASAGDDVRLGAWFRGRAARALETARKWPEADEIYRGTLEQLPSEASDLRALIILDWASATSLRGGALADALKRFDQAIALLREPDHSPLALAAALYRAGGAAAAGEAMQRAQVYLVESLSIRERVAPASAVTARSFGLLAGVERRRGALDQAADHYSRAIRITEIAAPGSLDLSRLIQGLGTVEGDRSNFDQAGQLLSRALAMQTALAPNSGPVADTLNNLGLLQWTMGDLSAAEQSFQKGLAIRETMAPGGFEAARTLSNLAPLLVERGDLAAAEQVAQKALEIQERLAPGGVSVATTLNSLGVIARDRGDLASAADYYRKALDIFQRDAPAGPTTSGIRVNLAEIAIERGRFTAAAQLLHRSLAAEIARAPRSADVASTLHAIAVLEKRRGNPAAAARHFARALSIQEGLTPGSLAVAAILADMGSFALEQRQFARAAELNRRALAIRERLAPGSAIEADCLHALATVAEHDGDIAEATKYAERAIEGIEAQVRRVGGGDETRSNLSARFTAYYRHYIDLLLAQHQTDAAFHVLERSRARSLLTMLAERDLLLSSDLPAELQHRRQLNAATYERVQAEIGDLDPRKDAAEIETLVARLRTLAVERRTIAEAVRSASPRLASLQYPVPLTSREAQALLDPGTVVLSYSVGLVDTVVFVLRGGPSPILESHRVPFGAKRLRADISAFRTLLDRPTSPMPAVELAARRLYRQLLLPAETQIAAADRVVIVPDGPLHVLPFAALRRGPQFLVQWKPMHTALSMTVYAEMRKLPAAPAGDLALVAFGDARPPDLKSTTALSVERGQGDRRSADFGPLPFSRVEVEAIARPFGPRARTLLGPDATEQQAKALNQRVKYLHFATHGVLDERVPLNSALVLSASDTPAGAQENGLLQAWEILEGVRWDVDLVVLSACRTGLGEERGGEGLMGLTRAIQYAGARSVIASLWNVDDRRTAQLMERFYARLADGLGRDAALQAAQNAVRETPGSQHPFYWAAFSLSGDPH